MLKEITYYDLLCKALTHKHTGEDKFWGKISIKGPNDCHIWTGHTSEGYGRIRIGNKMVLAHRIAWELVNGPVPDGKMILHKCDNSLCCNSKHLYCGTGSDNISDRATRNPDGQGGKPPKLYEGEIWLIRKLWKEGKGGISQRFIAKMFKMSQSTIHFIVNSSKWPCKEGYYI